MPEREQKPLSFNNGKAVQFVNPHQSTWLTHWTGTNLDATPSTHDHDLIDHDIKKPKPDIPIGVETTSDNFGSLKGIQDVDLAISLKKPSSQSFPFFKIGQESGRSPIMTDEGDTRGTQVSVFEPEGVSQIPTERVKYHMFFGESSYACSRPSAVFESNEPKTSSTFMEREKSEMPSFLKQNNPTRFKIDPSTSSNHSPAFIEEQYQRMQKHFRMGIFPNQIGSQETTKSATAHHGPCSFQNLPHYVHDVETTRICTPLEGLAGGLHSFSRTTHSLLITKQTDVNLFQENQIFRESRVSTRFKGKAPEGFQCSPSHFAHVQRGVKLQLLGSSSDRESKDDVKTVTDVQKNESSAETDAMDMESFKEMNHLSGAHSSRSNKDGTEESKLPPLPPIAFSAKKDRHKIHKIELPDINLELSSLPATSSSTDKAEPCPSRTQSLDMNTMRFKHDHNSNSKSDDDGSETKPGPDPESRWIKRLKLTSASSSLVVGTKPSKLPEPSCHGKLNKFLTQVNTGANKPEPTLEKGPETEIGAKRECKDAITLSHSWIRRWSRKNPEMGESFKPENGKIAVEELHKKQFPSIAAMALMGKTMTGFQRCEFRKKESFVVWNTKGF